MSFGEFLGWIFVPLSCSSSWIFEHRDFIYPAIIIPLFRDIFAFGSSRQSFFTDEEETGLSIVLFSDPKPFDEVFLNTLARSFSDESFTDSSSCSYIFSNNCLCFVLQVSPSRLIGTNEQQTVHK